MKRCVIRFVLAHATFFSLLCLLSGPRNPNSDPLGSSGEGFAELLNNQSTIEFSLVRLAVIAGLLGLRSVCGPHIVNRFRSDR